MSPPPAFRPTALLLGLLLAGSTVLAAELGEPAGPACPADSHEAADDGDAPRKRGGSITASASGKAGVSATTTRRARWPSLLPGMFK